MTNAAFSTWTHPATGAVRIYINAAAFGSTKVWVEQCAADAFGYTYTIRAQRRAALPPCRAARVVYFGQACINAAASAACPSAASATPLYFVTHSANTALLVAA